MFRAELHYFRDIAHQDIYIEAAAAVGGEKSAGGERYFLKEENLQLKKNSEN